MSNEPISKSAFMADFLSATVPAQKNGAVREFNRVVVEVWPQIPEEQQGSGAYKFVMSDEEVYLSNIQAEEFRQKLGTQAMDMLTGLADRHRIHIVLHASACDERDDAPDTGDLIDFYKSHGFFKCGPNQLMTRTPKGP